MMDNLAGPHLNISQIANFLRISVRTAYRMIEAGELSQGRFIHGQRRWYFSEIEELARFGTRPEESLSSRAK